MFSSSKSQLRSNVDDGYEMADPTAHPKANSRTGAGDAFDLRKYRRGGDNQSFSGRSDEGVAGIMKTMDVSVKYSVDDGRSREGRHSSVDSLV